MTGLPQPTPLHTTDELVAELVDLTDKIIQLQERSATIRAHLGQLPPNTYTTPAGKITVRPPSRRFDLAGAWRALTPQQQALCVSPDAKKVKAQLAPVVIDGFMVAGDGPNVVVLS